MKIISIDIGLINLGIIAAELNEDYTLKKIHDCDLVDITSGCRLNNCNLSHDNCIADYMSHFFEEYKESLEEADIILIEQQPPGGLIAIQELIRYQFRKKTISISPRSVHCFLNINHLDYEKRKKASTDIAIKKLNGFKNFMFQERKHDMSDAYCQLFYWIHKKNKEYRKMEEDAQIKKDFSGIIKSMESFKFDAEKAMESYKLRSLQMDL